MPSAEAFEHFLDASAVLKELEEHLKPEGRIFITFSCPWYSPWGAHMFYFTRLPWIQLLFSERVVMAIRANYRSDGARTYSECGLAKMTVAKFERITAHLGTRMEFCRCDCVHQLNFMAQIPILRELFINRVSCILSRP